MAQALLNDIVWSPGAATPGARRPAPGARTRERVIDAEFCAPKKICMTGRSGARDGADAVTSERMRIGDSLVRSPSERLHAVARAAHPVGRDVGVAARGSLHGSWPALFRHPRLAC